MSSRDALRLALILTLAGGCTPSERPRARTPVTPAVAAPARAPEPRAALPPEAGPSAHRLQTGRASYYSDRLAGRATASGEPYDPTRLTAAHRTLPFGSIVAVTRDDGRRVEVRINDRGPFGGGRRVIDVSRRAAAELGMLEAGVIDVQLEVIHVPERKPSRRRR